MPYSGNRRLDVAPTAKLPLLGLLAGAGSFASEERRENNLTLLRLVAAAAVLFSHSWPLSSGARAVDPVTAFLGEVTGSALSLAGLAVNAFFVISGYLVTKSAIRSKARPYYWLSRVLRIYPALIVNVLIVALVLGPAVTALPLSEYFRGEKLSEYLTNNILMWNTVYHLPGAFEDNPESAVNGSLWTLPVELRCYVAVGLMALAGVFKFRLLASALCAAILLFGFLSEDYAPFGNLAVLENVGYFILGAHFFMYRDIIPASPFAALLLIIGGVWLPLGAVGAIAAAAGFAWLILWAGLAAPRVVNIEGRLGDPSYGIYIWAFPIQQALVQALGGDAPWLIVAIAFPLTVIMGVASWRFIEKPALSKKSVAASFSMERMKSLGGVFNKGRSA
ncbi:acyltransferase family protein [Hyphococcus sp.]|uniref:acyltransferase family protein n=1 Tax=Hyphococcus sp. TaxID=2038636 RepID=UPI0035C72CAA